MTATALMLLEALFLAPVIVVVLWMIWELFNGF